MQTFGTPIDRSIPGEKVIEPGDPFYWEISDETKQILKEIDQNRQLAASNAHRIYFD